MARRTRTSTGKTTIALVGTLLADPSGIPISNVVEVDDDELLLVGTSKDGMDMHRHGRLMRLAADGSVVVRVDADGGFELIGITGDVLWVDNLELGVHARRLSDLTLLDATYPRATPCGRSRPTTRRPASPRGSCP